MWYYYEHASGGVEVIRRCVIHEQWKFEHGCHFLSIVSPCMETLWCCIHVNTARPYTFSRMERVSLKEWWFYCQVNSSIPFLKLVNFTVCGYHGYRFFAILVLLPYCSCNSWWELKKIIHHAFPLRSCITTKSWNWKWRRKETRLTRVCLLSESKYYHRRTSRLGWTSCPLKGQDDHLF